MFVNEEDIPVVHQDEDYDDYNTPSASRIDETSFVESDTAKAISTLRSRQKVKQGKIIALYRRLKVAGNPDLIDLDQFMIKNSNTASTELLFLDGNNHWQSLTNKRNRGFLSAKILREKFGGLLN